MFSLWWKTLSGRYVVFAGECDRLGEPLYLELHRIRRGEQTIDRHGAHNVLAVPPL